MKKIHAQHRSFDIIGDIAILQRKEGKKEKKGKIERKKEKAFAKNLIKKHKNIKAVYTREKISGRLRLPKLRWLAGSKKTETTHKESGCLMKLDIKKCYFSPRLSHDRLEIAKKIKSGEKVLVMFSGVAPYALVIAKHSKAKIIFCVELSRAATKYAKENVMLNKFDDIEVLQGNVKKIIPKLKMKFDRIVMARPQLKETFLKEAFLAAKKGTIVHFYDFLRKEEFPKATAKITEISKKTKKKIKILNYKKVREIAPYKYHVRVDFKIK